LTTAEAAGAEALRHETVAKDTKRIEREQEEASERPDREM